jgi:hypothetical protein
MVSNAPSCGVTYDRHSDDSSGVIYDRKMFIVQANCLIFGMRSTTKFDDVETGKLGVHDVEVERVFVLQHLAADVAQDAKLALLHLRRHLRPGL